MIGYSIKQIIAGRSLNGTTTAWKEPDMTIIEQLRNESVFSEGKEYIIRNLTENDRFSYFHTLIEVSLIPQIYETEGFQDIAWKDIMTSDSSLIFAVEKKCDHTYVGDCMLKLYGCNSLEVGFDVSSDYQNNGIGTEIMRMLLKEIKDRFPEKRIIARVYSDNDKSLHILKNLGGWKIGEELSEYETALAIISQLNEKNIKKASSNTEMLSRNHIDILAFM